MENRVSFILLNSLEVHRLPPPEDKVPWNIRVPEAAGLQALSYVNRLSFLLTPLPGSPIQV